MQRMRIRTLCLRSLQRARAILTAVAAIVQLNTAVRPTPIRSRTVLNLHSLKQRESVITIVMVLMPVAVSPRFSVWSMA
jgi:hypothetical protein